MWILREGKSLTLVIPSLEPVQGLGEKQRAGGFLAEHRAPCSEEYYAA
jgi:hypothetical protein